MERKPEDFGLVGLFLRDVVMFAGVVFEIVKLDPHVLVPLDELVVATADRSRRAAALIPIMRVMPEKGPVGELLSVEQPSEADAVEVLFGAQRQASHLQHRGVIIRADDWRVAN